MDSDYEYDDNDYNNDDQEDFYTDDEPEADVEDMVQGEEIADKEEDTVEVEDKKMILTSTDLLNTMRSIIQNVQSILQVSPAVCRILLQKFNWNKDMLLERFYESPNFLVDYCIVPKDEASPKEYPHDPEEPQECEICCDFTKLVGLDCGHLACRECWKSYLEEKMKEGKSEIECMASDCKLLAPDDTLKTFLDPKSIANFENLTIKSYVEVSKNLTHCPKEPCQNILKSQTPGAHCVVCWCGHQFCFSCGDEPHDPATCRHLKLWKKKAEAEKNRTASEGFSSNNETFQWILSNTKDCPKCLTAIEKNGGCNRIMCRSKTCRFEFCWLCMRSWDVHGYSPCNTFNADEEKSRIDARAELLRFMFFYNRFKAHEQSLLLEKKLLQKIGDKMDQMQEAGASWTEVLFLRKAVDSLSSCRQTLMHTYIFAYYLERNNIAIIFESNQQDLEMAVEQLSGFLEQDLDTADMKSLSQKVQDKARYVEQRQKVLCEHCEEGLEQENWVFIA